jgi:hypothetical protein
VQDRERVDALAQVLSRLLAEGLLAGRQVHDVVGELEGQTERLAVLLEHVQGLGRSVGQHPAQPARGGDQRAGLPADDVEVVGLRLLDPPGGLDLADLAIAQRRDRPGQQRADVGPEVGRDLGGLGEQVIAGEDRDGVAPSGVRRPHRVSRVRLVDHVVVVQRRLVHELDRDRAGDQPRVRGVAEVPGEQDEHRPEPLPAGREQVLRGLGQHVRVGSDGLLQRGLDLVEASPDLAFEYGIGGLEARDHAAAHRPDPTVIRRAVWRVTIAAPPPVRGSPRSGPGTRRRPRRGPPAPRERRAATTTRPDECPPPARA